MIICYNEMNPLLGCLWKNVMSYKFSDCLSKRKRSKLYEELSVSRRVLSRSS